MISSRLCGQSLRQEHNAWPMEAKRANGQPSIRTGSLRGGELIKFRGMIERNMPVKALLILSPLLLLFCGCVSNPNRDVRAFNACLTRHPQDDRLCEGPRQAYEVELPALAARSAPRVGMSQ